MAIKMSDSSKPSKILPFLEKGWWFSELPKYRPHPGRIATYSLFSYADLPPIEEELDDEFGWLLAQPIRVSSFEDEEDEDFDHGSAPVEEKLEAIMAEVPVTLPAAFIHFMRTRELRQRIRSCTDCYWSVADWATPTTGVEDGFLIHYLSDSQGCLHWYLYLDPRGNHCVVVSAEAYGFSVEDAATDAASRQQAIDLTQEAFWFCAPSFQEFIYRFWIENEIWYALAWDKQPLTPRQQAYADHYKKLGNNSLT